MLRWWYRARIFRTIYALSKDAERTDDAFAAVNAMINALTKEELEKYSKVLCAYPGFKEISADTDPRLRTLFDLDALSRMPENTLAGAYSRFVHTHGYKVDWYVNVEEKTPIHFSRNRFLKTHDIIHTITGFSGSPAGEIGVQSFYFAQEPALVLPVAFMAARLIAGLDADKERQNMDLMDCIAAGHQMGKRAKPVLFRKWENDWGRDLSELRREIGIVPFSSNSNS